VPITVIVWGVQAAIAAKWKSWETLYPVCDILVAVYTGIFASALCGAGRRGSTAATQLYNIKRGTVDCRRNIAREIGKHVVNR